MSGTRYLLTQSLLAAWNYLYTSVDIQKAETDFIRVLRREPGETNQAMHDGIEFEDLVTAYIGGCHPSPKHKWYNAICEAGEIVQGAEPQVKVYREANIDGVNFLLYGRIDYLRAGVIYDTKFSHGYYVGKYLNSPQHPMYFACEPGAYRFVYIVSDGRSVFREEYLRKETPSIESIVPHFLRYLDDTGLRDTYYQHWRSSQ